MDATLTQFLIDIVRGASKREFSSNPDAVIRASALDAELQEAVRTHDIARLWLAGAHPMALMYFSRSIGWSNDRYYSCLDEAEARRGAPAGSR